MDIQNIFLVIVSVVNLFWGLLILSQSRDRKPNLFFSFVIFSVVAWTLAIIGYRLVASELYALLLCRFLYVAAIFIPLFFLYFTFIFPQKSKTCSRKYFIAIFLPAGVLVILTAFTNLIISSVSVVVGENVITFGPLYIFYAAYISGYFTWTLINLFIGVIKNSGVVRSQLIYIFTGLLASSSIAMLTNLFLPWFGYYKLNWVGQISTVLWVSITSYAIAKHHLMNIKAIATELFAGLLVIVSLVPVFQTNTTAELVFRISVFVVTSFFAGLLIQSVLREVKRREGMENLAKELKQAGKDLKKANKELKRLDNAKSEFLSIASHQLRTPLTVIKGYVSMMQEGSFGKVPKLIGLNLDKVYISTERLIGLVESLLNISRIESGRLEFDIQPTDLNEVVSLITEDFQQKARKKKLKLEFTADKSIPRVAIDQQKIKEVISNIIDNSIKYTEKGSVTIGLHQESSSVVFTCQDTGIGVIPEDLPRLFEKFVRGKGMMQVYTEGTGLGMYFARMIVENMGGRIWVESPGKNKGSKFSFSVPLADNKKAKKVK